MRFHRAAAGPAISAHRGGGEFAPAGTWAAFDATLGTPVEYVELDVRRTRDGVWVIRHDEYAGRPARPVRTLRYDELCQAAGYLVPEATAVMQAVAGRFVGHLDLKEPAGEAAIVGPAVDIFGADGFVVTTEHPASLRRVRSFAPAVRTALSTGPSFRLGRTPWNPRRSWSFDPRWVLDSGAHGVALNHRLAADGVLERFRRDGLAVMLWTVNDPSLIARYLAEPRIDVLVTDRPWLAFELRSQVAAPRERQLVP